MSVELAEQIPGESRVAGYEGGEITYSVIGEESRRHNPTLVIPGFTAGEYVFAEFAQTLHELGEREVIFLGQPTIEKGSAKKMPIVDHCARAILAVVIREQLEHRPVDVIAHSFAALSFTRAAVLADIDGISCFRHEEGSRSVFVAPAGSHPKESPLYLASRFGLFVLQGRPYGKILDPDGDMFAAGIKNARQDLRKTGRELLDLSKPEKIYSYLAWYGLRPTILGYPAEYIYPHRTIKPIVTENEDLSGYVTPWEPSEVNARNRLTFRYKSGLKGRAALAGWAHHLRNAGHNDLQFHPARTIKTILEIWDKTNNPAPADWRERLILAGVASPEEEIELTPDH